MGSTDGQLWHYVIKREFAEGAIYMAMFAFPRGALQLNRSSDDLYLYR